MTNQELDDLLTRYLAEPDETKANVLLAQLNAEYAKLGLLVKTQ